MMNEKYKDGGLVRRMIDGETEGRTGMVINECWRDRVNGFWLSFAIRSLRLLQRKVLFSSLREM